MAKTKKLLTPAEEEARAKKRAKNLEKARAQRAANSQQKIAGMIWARIGPRLKQGKCKCGLKKGMTLDDLRALGAGCTDPVDYKYLILKESRPVFKTEEERKQYNSQRGHQNPGHVCPILSTYRRYLERPQLLYATESTESAAA